MVQVGSATPAWPSVTDDDGTGTSGTVWNDAFDASCQATLDALLHSSTNPTVTPKAIIDEVVTARGSKASLDERLDVSLENDGTLKNQSTLTTDTEASHLLGSIDRVANGDLVTWSSGASAAPDAFTLSGAGAAIVRTGSGEADTFSFLAGQYSAKITYGAATAKATQEVIPTATFSNQTKLRSRTFTAGMWGKTSVANQLSIVVDDGVTTTRGGASGNGTYHTGGGSEEWLYCTHTLSASATKLDVYAEVAQAGSAYFGGMVGMFSDIAVDRWTPSPVPDASATVRGLVNVGTQTWEGVKTFRDPPLYNDGTTTGTFFAAKYARKGSNTTVNNSTVLVNATDLAFAVAASEVWEFEFYIIGSSGGTPDFDFALTGPAAPTYIGYAITGPAAPSASVIAEAFGTEIMGTGLGAGTKGVYWIQGTLRNGANAGTVQLQFAQNTMNASDSIVYAESFVIARRIA